MHLCDLILFQTNLIPKSRNKASSRCILMHEFTFLSCYSAVAISTCNLKMFLSKPNHSKLTTYVHNSENSVHFILHNLRFKLQQQTLVPKIQLLMHTTTRKTNNVTITLQNIGSVHSSISNLTESLHRSLEEQLESDSSQLKGYMLLDSCLYIGMPHIYSYISLLHSDQG